MLACRMFRAVFALCLFATACGGGGGTAIDASPVDAGPLVDAPLSAACLDAETHSDLTWIQANIFSKQCTFSGCHNGASGDAGKMDLRAGHSFTSLVGVKAHLCQATSIVTAGHPEQSYMMVMIGQQTPAAQTPPSCAIDPMVGEMPQGNPTVLLCSQKRDAIERWITAGALNN